MNGNEFLALGVEPALIEKLTQQGIAAPTAVQRAAIAALLSGRDALLQARTGSGKTLAFVLPRLQQPGMTVIVAPTRELAEQLHAVVGGFVEPADLALVCGGRDWDTQRVRLQCGVRWLIATPGRLLAQLRQGNVRTTDCAALVLDEADQLLETGFWEDVAEIAARLAQRRQTILVSATLPQPVRQLAGEVLTEPLVWAEEAESPNGIRQVFVDVGKRDKSNVLCGLINSHCSGQGIVFCRTHWRAERLLQLLKQRGYPVSLLHGKLTQRQRDAAIGEFRAGMTQLLVATEVASRGLDIAEVSHVFNYDIPRESDAYLHRIGRTGRAGRNGAAYTLIGPGDAQYVRALRKLLCDEPLWEK